MMRDFGRTLLILLGQPIKVVKAIVKEMKRGGVRYTSSWILPSNEVRG